MRKLRNISILTILVSALLFTTGVSPKVLANSVTPEHLQFIENLQIGQTFTDTEAVFKVLQELHYINRAWEDTPGWKQTVYEQYEAYKENNPVLVPISYSPAWQHVELWQQVISTSTERVAGGSYFVATGRDGEQIQVAASDSAGHGGNITLMKLGQQMSASERASLANIPLEEYFETYPQRLMRRINESDNLITSLQAVVEEMNGVKVLTITIQDVMEPTYFDDLAFTVIGGRSTRSYSLNTGNPVRSVGELIDDQGQFHFYYEYNYLVFEHGLATLPEEVEKAYATDLAEAKRLQEGLSQAFQEPALSLFKLYPSQRHHVGTSTGEARYFAETLIPVNGNLTIHPMRH